MVNKRVQNVVLGCNLKNDRPPCPTPTPRVYSNSCPSCRWCHPTISSSVIPFSSCPQSLPASGSFPMSQLFAWGGQSTGVSASASVLPVNTQDWSPLGWTGWISLQSKGLSRVFSNITVQKHQHVSVSQSVSSVSQSCATLCDPMNPSMPGFPIHHQLPEFTQIHAHRVSDAIQPSHPLSSPSPPAPNPSQNQGLFQWVSSLHEVAKVLEFQLQHQSFQWTPRTDLLYDGLVVSPCSPRDSQESSPSPQFKRINSSSLSFLYSPTLTSIHNHCKNHSFDQMDLCWQSNVSAF